MALALLRGTMRQKCLIEHSYISCKFYSAKTDDKKSTTSSTFSRDKIKKNVESYVFAKSIDYLKNYEKVLEKKFPTAMNVYRTFVIGMKDLYRDMKQFLKIYKIANTSALHLRALTRKELELYYQMPKDLKKVTPVFLISALPLANYVIFPLAYMYPRTFLSSHFWSIQQKFQFQKDILHERLTFNIKVFRFLQSKLETSQNDKQYNELKTILGLLGSGLHPSVSQLIEIKDLFSRPPFNLRSLPGQHLKYLCGLHAIHKGFNKRYRLTEHAYVIHHMDLAIRREGGVHNMPIDSLSHACFLRGLNVANLSNDMMIEWLKQWVEISLVVDGDNVSLLLHLPILIGYNHPNNWILLYNK